MTTENTHDNYSDSDEAVVEQLSVSPTTSSPPSSESTTPAEATVHEHREGQVQQEEEHSPAFRFVEEAPLHHAEAVGIEHETTGDRFPFSEVIPPVEEEAMRPFTDFIEEFRQAEEARFSSTSRESTAEPASTPWEGTSFAAEPSAVRLDGPGEVKNESTVLQVEQTTVNTPVENVTEVLGTQGPTATAPIPPVERPVSPLLRPASRLRLPRHGAGRQREEQVVAEKAPVVPATEPPSTQEQQPPARRYRFDRPATSNVPESKEKDSRSRPRALPLVPARVTSQKEAKEGEGQPKQVAAVVQPTEPKQPTITETPVSNSGGTTAEAPAATSYDRHRRHGQDRQPALSHAVPVAPAAEVVVPESESAQTVEVAPEDLPPLEYSELQRASSRRRRRRRSGDTVLPPPIGGLTTKPAGAEPPAPQTPPPPALLPVPTQTPSVAVPRSGTPVPVVPPSPAVTPAAGQYNIVSGYTVSQMNQSGDGTGPFMSPEPSPARGSTAVRGGARTIRVDAQRPAIYPVRSGDIAVNQLANAVVQAIQSQTDRMVSELRRAGQGPTNVAVTLPPFPSTERVGVFVDVANLLYSARTLRMTVDFAKLLDFLRGNRRLVRAHAYCPTSPQSGDDQMFLQAVKGLGYRITTKNYKTFSSGAKKADLDLDLCMDVVRLVDGRAVDCIVLVSGDSDFMPMLDYCSDHGVRVEVAAFDEAVSATLRQSCDLFINLAILEEIRA